MLAQKHSFGKRALTVLAAILSIFLLAASPASAGDFDGGDGTREKPYKIKTVGQFNNIRKYPDKHFVLVADLDFGQESAVTPIGSRSKGALDMKKAFTGSLDGDWHVIANLAINSSGKDDAGIFGVVAGTPSNAAEIKNLGLKKICVEGANNTAALIGLAHGNVRIVEVRLLGEESNNLIEGVNSVAGIVGSAEGGVTVERCFAACTVWGENGLGGMAGSVSADSVISHSRAQSKVTGRGHIGGFAGCVYGTIINSSSASEVLSMGEDHDVSCFVGTLFNNGKIENCFSRGIVQGFVNIGGLVGRTLNYYADGVTPPNPMPKPTITGSRSAGTVRGAAMIGGLIGYAQGNTIIDGCMASGTVEAVSCGDISHGFHAGGLVGKADQGTLISNCSSYGKVTGDEVVAGLIGYLGENSAITDSTSDTEVEGMIDIGGLVGCCFGRVEQAHAIGKVTLRDDGYDAGGVAGALLNNGSITRCQFSGVVSGHKNIGGIAGKTFIYYEKGKAPAKLPRSTVSGCVVNGTVKGDANVGGIIGFAGENSLIEANKVSCIVEGGDVDSTGTIAGVTMPGAKVTDAPR